MVAQRASHHKFYQDMGPRRGLELGGGILDYRRTSVVGVDQAPDTRQVRTSSRTMFALGVRRGKAALFQWVQVPSGHRSSGCNRSSHGGDEMAEAFGTACHELVSLDFRCGSRTEVQRGPRNVRSWGHSGSRFRTAGGLLVAKSGHSCDCVARPYPKDFASIPTSRCATLTTIRSASVVPSAWPFSKSPSIRPIRLVTCAKQITGLPRALAKA